MITGKINCVKIDKAKLFEGKNGAKWLDIVLIETPNSDYGDFMIVQDTSKEDRAKGIKGAILGNAKIFLKRGQEKPVAKAKDDDDGDPVPF